MAAAGPDRPAASARDPAGARRRASIPARSPDTVINEAAVRVAVVVKPAAAAAVATTFSFPLALMVAVLLFLFVQRFLDARDPKLRAAPRSMADALLEFQEEERL